MISLRILLTKNLYPLWMNNLRDNLHCNNNPESIRSAPRNMDWTIENNTWKLATVCLPSVKHLAKKILKIWSQYYIRTIFKSSSTLWKYIFWVKPSTKCNMTKTCVYSIPCSCGNIYKGETCCLLKVRREEHWKAVVCEIEKLGTADHIWKEKGNHLILQDEVKK